MSGYDPENNVLDVGFTMAGLNAISCRGLTKIYKGRPPTHAVRGIDLDVAKGECFGLLGPNGAGKTTTIEIIEGLLEPTSGEVEVLGRIWKKDAEEIKQRLGISLQETRLAEKLTVRETLTLFRSFYRQGLDPQQAMERVSLEEKADTWVIKLSGGQRQRLAVASALVGNPELLCLDEPTTGLDPQARRQLWDVIRHFRSEGRSVLLTTHAMDEAERLCDRVAIVDLGKIIALGTPQALIEELGSEHIVEITVDIEAARQLDVETLQELPEVQSARMDESTLYVSVRALQRTLPEILNQLSSMHCKVVHLSSRPVTLEDVFINLTGRRLREAKEAS